MKLTTKIPFALLLLGTTLVSWAQNNPPIGCVTDTTNCCGQGSVKDKGALSFYTAITCVGSGVTPPTASGTDFNPGLRCDNYTDTCNNTNWTVYTSVPYTAGQLYWDPPIPSAFSSCGQYTFYGKVDGTPSDPLCSKVTATVGPGSPGTPFTVWVVQAELEAVDYWSDFTPFYNYNTDFAGDGTTTFSRPVWQRSPATNNPVVQPQGQAVELNVTINVCPYGLAFELIGVSSVPGLCFTNTDVIAAGGNQDVRVTASVPLANSVDVVIGSIDWYALIGGPAWNSPTQMCFLNTSGPHTNYVTWGTPITQTGNTATLKRMDWAARTCATRSTPHGCLTNIHNAVGSYDLKRTDPPNPIWVIAGGAPAQCFEMAEFYGTVAHLLGIPGGDVVYIYPKVGKTVNETMGQTNNESRLIASSNPAHPTPTTHDDFAPSELLGFRDNGTNPGDNNFESCFKYTSDSLTIYYAGGAGIYTTAQQVMNAVCHWTFWGYTTAVGYDYCTNPGPFHVDDWP